jgi:uncharacterized Zn ribbon protein
MSIKDSNENSLLKIEKFNVIMPLKVGDSSIFDRSKFNVQIVNDDDDEDCKLVIIRPIKQPKE